MKNLVSSAFVNSLRKAIHLGLLEMAPTEQIRELAEKALLQHALSSADGLQLAVALAWCGERPHNRQFICGDKKLSEVAGKVGFDVVLLPS